MNNKLKLLITLLCIAPGLLAGQQSGPKSSQPEPVYIRAGEAGSINWRKKSR
jgi:hypothetical protein